ncbi:MAG: ABC transporter ATP-binding protein [Clostridia bacterium]|nr:ABC transporter ATP-binding protein [Clostridia bacterium]MBN2882988.1 ABC transporter ATP-binding protein [Clostridia bacterium]
MIEIKNIQFKYPGNKENTINGMDFDVNKGEIFGFLGPSGAGKTTTQKLITGLLKGYTGNIKVDGRERSNWDNSFYEKIGVVFEVPNLYLKLTGRENLELFGGYYKSKPLDMRKLLDRIGILDAMDKKVEEYSKGMKVRLNFARALLHNPDILFLDEPISGLDPSNGAIIKQIIMELREQGKTIFLTTHNMGVAAELCDRVAFIVGGRLPLIDSPSNLMREYGSNELVVEHSNGESAQKSIFSLTGLSENEDFQNILRKDSILSIKTLDASLEDIFIMVTGRGLE